MKKNKKDRRNEPQPGTRLTVLNDGVERSKRGATVQKKDTPAYQERVQRIYEYLREGMSSEEIYAIICIEPDDISYRTFELLVTEAYELADIEAHKDREYIFQLHMDRYEKMYEEALKLEGWAGVPLDPVKDRQVIRSRYATALRCLKSKEELLGLHDKSVILEFNDNKAVIIEKSDMRGLPGFNFERLVLDEKIELLNYIRTCRVAPVIGVHKIVIKRTIVEVNPATGDRRAFQNIQNIQGSQMVQDITFEEMPENVLALMADTTPPVPEEEPIRDPVEDLTGGLGNKEKKEGRDVLETMKRNMIEELKKKMKGK